MKKNLIALVLFFIYYAGFSQQQDSSCLHIVKNFIERSAFDKPLGDDIYFVEYVVKSILRDKTAEPVTASFKVYSGENQVHVINDFVSVYKDSKFVYAILPSKKIIHLTDIPKEVKKNDPADLSKLQKEIVSSALIKSCKETSSKDSKYDKELLIELSPQNQKKYSIVNIKYLIDSKNNSLYKISLFYNSLSDVERIDYTFNKIDLHYKDKGVDLNTPLRSMFFSSENSLIPKYKNYQFIDSRTKKN